MKRTISLLLLCMIWFVASAQQHMKFMGIPLDGTITTFTTKLQAKGVKISPNNSKSGAGCRWFVGSFFGQSAEIYVYYNPTTKIVYRAKAVIERDKFEQLKNIYDEISTSIDSKYLGRHKEDTYEGKVSIHYDIDLETSADYYEGSIDLFFTDNGLTYYTTYYLHIDYYDEANRRKHERSINNDI